MQRVAIFGVCALAVAALVWLLVRAGEPHGRGEPAAGVTAESPSQSAGSLDAADRRTGARPNDVGSAGAPDRAGEFTGQRGVARSSAGDEPAGASGSGSPGARSDGQSTGQRSEAGAGDAERNTPHDAARSAVQQPSTEGGALPDAEGDEGTPSDPTPEATEGRVMTAEEARDLANQQLGPDDGRLTPEQREDLLEQLTDDNLDKSKNADRFTN